MTDARILTPRDCGRGGASGGDIFDSKKRLRKDDARQVLLHGRTATFIIGGQNCEERIMPDVTITRLGWVLSGLFALFMLGASVLPKLAGMAVATDTMAALGWPDAPVLMIGVIELVLTVMFLIRPVAVLGAVLMMALLGGAMVTQIRAGSPLLSHTLFSIYLGVVMWAALWCRLPALRALFPLVR
jgi:hypothetical protein